MLLPDVPEALLAQLSAFVTTQLGLHFPPPAWPDLIRGVAAVAHEQGCPDLLSCIRWLLAPPVTPQRIALLARHLTIGETYFFREQATLELLEKQILPELIAARRAQGRRLRIWSAACCTGEEPYTLAIILQRLLPDWPQWNLTILGTDINPQFLQQAGEGICREHSFRTTPPETKARCFTPVAGGYAIRPEFKQMVRFAPLNLAGAAYPALATNTTAMDIIFCRNVLMYFSPEAVRHTLTNFYHALADDGWLIVNPSEASPVFSPQYEMVAFPEAILYKKRSRPAPTLAGPPRRPAPPAPRPANVAPPQPRAQASQGSTLPGRGPAPSGGLAAPQAAPPTPANWEQAQALYQAGQYHAAREQLGALVAQGQADAPLFALLARIEANQGQLSAALAWSQQAIVADKLNPAQHYLQATILQEQGAWREAAAGLGRALYLDPDFVLAYFALGQLHLTQGQPDAAHKYFATTRTLLRAYAPAAPLPEADGLTAGYLDAIAATMLTRTEGTHDHARFAPEHR